MTSAKIAELVLNRLNLRPPVDVMAVLALYADVEEVDWPFACDGLATRLVGPKRPRIFLRNNQPPNRKRFTAAHELGHVLIPWHVEEMPCHIERFSRSGREQEATDFASHLLVPRTFLSGVLRATQNPGRWLESLEVCEISAQAGVLALETMLPAGYSFIIEQPANPNIAIHSSGTQPPFKGGALDEAALSRESLDSGAVIVRGLRVRWYRLIVDKLPARDLAGDSRATLDGLLSRWGAKLPDGRDVAVTLSSMIAGKLRDSSRQCTAGQMYGVLERHMRQSASFDRMLEDDDFHTYLAQKALEFERRRAKA